MPDHNSRYAASSIRIHTDSGGKVISYRSWRMLPPGRSLPAHLLVRTTSNDRPDLIATRAMGDPMLFWRICDANDAMHPLDLTARIGRAVRIPKSGP